MPKIYVAVMVDREEAARFYGDAATQKAEAWVAAQDWDEHIKAHEGDCDVTVSEPALVGTPLHDKLWIVRHSDKGVFYAIGASPAEAWAVTIEKVYGIPREDRLYSLRREQLAAEGWRARRCTIVVEDL